MGFMHMPCIVDDCYLITESITTVQVVGVASRRLSFIVPQAPS
jgi:hypothetical protein